MNEQMKRLLGTTLERVEKMPRVTIIRRVDNQRLTLKCRYGKVVSVAIK